MKIRSIVIIAFALISCFARSQANTRDSLQADTLKNQKHSMSKSPMGAVYRSLVLPGWGQYYVESYWKIPIFTGGMIASSYFIVDYHNKYSNKVREIDSFLAADTLNFGSNKHLLLKRQREFYRDNRDQAIFFLAGFYLVAAIDAYVGAHLFDFNVTDEVSLHLSPSYRNAVGINVSVSF